MLNLIGSLLIFSKYQLCSLPGTARNKESITEASYLILALGLPSISFKMVFVFSEFKLAVI